MEQPRVVVIMCVWNRLDKLTQTLEMIEEQDYPNFDFLIWNNSDKEIDYLDVVNSEENVGGVGRFMAAHQVSQDYDYVVFIDDDQIFGPTLISDFVKEAKPKTMSGWYAWELHGKYWNRTRNTPNPDYIGTCGMICDINAFRNKDVYTKLPKKYQFVEDLWLSFYCRYELGYELKPSNVEMSLMPNEENRGQFRLFNLRELKEDFYTYLKNEYNLI